MYDRAALKNKAKADLRDTRPRAVWVVLAFLAASFVISSVLNAVGRENTLLTAAMEMESLAEGYQSGLLDEAALLTKMLEAVKAVAPSAVGGWLLLSLVSAAVSWALGFGFQGYCLGVIRRENPGFLKLLRALPQLGWVLLTGLLVSLFIFLWGLFFVLGGAALIVALLFLLQNTALAATMSLVVFIGVVWGMVYITLRYVMANFILLDEKVDALEAIKRSKAMMRGRKWHYFELEISFIGWILLTSLISGVARGIATFAAMGSFFSGGDLVSAAMELAGGGDVFVQVLAWILTLPMLMWLRGYMGCAEAAFYDSMRSLDQQHGVWETDRDYRAHYISAEKDGPKTV